MEKLRDRLAKKFIPNRMYVELSKLPFVINLPDFCTSSILLNGSFMETHFPKNARVNLSTVVIKHVEVPSDIYCIEPVDNKGNLIICDTTMKTDHTIIKSDQQNQVYVHCSRLNSGHLWHTNTKLIYSRSTKPAIEQTGFVTELPTDCNTEFPRWAVISNFKVKRLTNAIICLEYSIIQFISVATVW